VARAIGITEDLIPSTAIHDTINFAQKSYSDSSKGKPFKPSMLVDLEAGRPMEIEGIVGAVVKQAKEAGISVPRYVLRIYSNF
jgi:2-dehydropantoate 2-reductase